MNLATDFKILYKKDIYFLILLRININPYKFKIRTEKYKFGEMFIPGDTYWGIHTQRAIDNFPLSGILVPNRLLQALALVKIVCCMANFELGYLTERVADYIIRACNNIREVLKFVILNGTK